MTNPAICRALAAAVLTIVASAVNASPQVFTGRIEVTVDDATNAVLPGVVVEISGPQKASAVTAADGTARFLNLEPGTYQVKASIAGFQEYTNTNVPVVAGGAMTLKIRLTVATVQEQVQVTAASPVVDRKKSRVATSVTVEELQNIPSARDPWVVMQTVPGVVVDKVNIGGSSAGTQSIYQSKGAAFSDGTWNMDGIPITDMSPGATGATPTYYDFDMFQEINVTTGGSDLTSPTGGVHLNLILKSGSNIWHGSSRMYFENEGLQSNNMSADLASTLGSRNGKGNRIDQYADYGFEAGGPVFKDRLWVWGSFGKTDARTAAITQALDRTVIRNRAFKAQAQLGARLRGGFTYFRGDKDKWGRGASALRPPETTLNQKGPSPLYKGEASMIIGNNLFLTGRVSDFPAAFGVVPQGGMDKNIWVDDGGVWHGSYFAYHSARPQQTIVADGSYFHGRHELKFGFSWRRATVDSASSISTGSGRPIWTAHNGYPNMIATAISNPGEQAERAYYTSGWIGDTISMDRVTLNLGLRLDRQSDGVLAMALPAAPGFDRWLPAISTPAIPDAVTWKSASPRASVSYALGNARTTSIRASYAMFASQLPNGISQQISVAQYRCVYFDAVDKNGNNVADYDEIDFNSIEGWRGFDMQDPGKLTAINRLGDYRVPKTHEVIVGLDHELFPDFGVSAAFTWRRMVDFNWTPRIGVTRADYVQSGTLAGCDLPDGTCYSVPYYKLVPALVPDMGAAQGTVVTARDGYNQRFLGVDVAATKRMSHRWMARFGFSTNKFQEFFDNPATAIVDPTPRQASNYLNGGSVVMMVSGGRSQVAMVMPKYQFAGDALYQAPRGIDVAANAVLRQGFGQPWYRSNVPTGDPLGSRKTVDLYSDVDRNRLPTVATVNLRLGWNPAKTFNVTRVGVHLDCDVFNLFNSGTVLGRQYDQRLSGQTGFNQILEILNPRVTRLGLRFTF